jgi:hypothetical protein
LHPSSMKRAQGKPDASRTRRPCVQRVTNTQASFTNRLTGDPAFPARWVNGLLRVSPRWKLSTVAATNALRLVTRLGDFDFETASTQALSRQDPHGFTVRLLWLRPSPRQLHRLPRTSRGFAHSGALLVVPAPFGVHRIPSRVRDVREAPLSWDGTGESVN